MYDYWYHHCTLCSVAHSDAPNVDRNGGDSTTAVAIQDDAVVGYLALFFVLGHVPDAKATDGHGSFANCFSYG